MKKSLSFAATFAVAVAILASVLALAAVAAWERSVVRVYEPSPAESLLLLRAGDVVDPSVQLGATVFEERTEKRIEGLDRAVLEYVFSAKDSGVAVTARLIELPHEQGADAEVAEMFRRAEIVRPPAVATRIPYTTSVDDILFVEAFRHAGREVRVVRKGTYVYVLELSDAAGASPVLDATLHTHMRQLDQPGYVLPLRSPKVLP